MEQLIAIADGELLRALFGPADRHAKGLQRAFGVDLMARDGGIKLVGEDEGVKRASAAIQRAIHVYRRDHVLSDDTWRRILEDGDATGAASGSPEELPRGVEPRTRGQDQYLQALHQHALTFAVGPAGTGKTFLAAAVAVAHLQSGAVRRIVLCRPAVEAGERLGFLPGDFQAKVNPYLRPLYDALYALLDVNQVNRYIGNDIIEIVPLAYMRGRTLERAFIILDEAQNTTPGQMKMFLTRMGRDSRVVVTGDITQVDLPPGQKSGLTDAIELIDGIDGISVVRLTKQDIVRHSLVQRIVEAYERRAMESQDAGG